MNGQDQQITTPVKEFTSPQQSGGGPKPKWLKIVIVISIVIILILIGGLIYSKLTQKTIESPSGEKIETEEQNKYSDWKIYQSKTFGIQVKIPKNFSTQITRDENKECVNLNFPTESKLSYCIGSYNIPAGEKSSIEIDGKDYDVFQEENEYEIPLDEDEEIIFIDNEDDYDLFREIIENFEFVQEETFGWKTYQNSQFGFEVKYPDILEMAEYYENYGNEENLIKIPNFENIIAEFDGPIFKRQEPENIGVVRIFVVDQPINDLLGIFRSQIENEQEFVNKFDIKMNFFDAGLQYYLIDKNPKTIIFVVENTSEELEAAKILSNFNFLN